MSGDIYDRTNLRHREITEQVGKELDDAIYEKKAPEEVTNGIITTRVMRRFFPNAQGEEAVRLYALLSLWADFNERKVLQHVVDKGVELAVELIPLNEIRQSIKKREDIH